MHRSPLNPPAPSAEPLPVARVGEKYERILNAAIEVIAEKGFSGARVSDIASRAGVADGTVYLYFDNKDHILRTAIDSAFAKFLSRVSAAVENENNPLEQLAIIARLHLETLSGQRSLAIVMQTEVRQSASFIAQFSHKTVADYVNLLREVIRRGQREGMIREEVSSRAAALCLFGGLDEMVSSWLFTGKEIDPAQASAQVLDVLLNGMSRRPHA